MKKLASIQGYEAGGMLERRHQNLLSSLDCHGTGAKRLHGEVLGPWRDSQDAVFWNVHGEKHFSGHPF